jgi:anti-sigma factor RsiW
MSPNQRQWEDLNSYVDGELAPASSARVAAEAASDPSVAGSIATLHAIKSALGTAYTQDTVVIATPSKAGMGGRGLQAAAYAACPGVPHAGVIWRHELGVGANAGSGATVGSAQFRAAGVDRQRRARRVEVPDISAAGLNRICREYPRPMALPAHIGYVGRRCRLNCSCRQRPALQPPVPE